MDSTTQFIKSFLHRYRFVFKGVFISFLVLFLMIPTLFINALVKERQFRREDVKNEVSSRWSSSQRLDGPVLILPYEELSSSGQQQQKERKLAYILPDDLVIEGDLQPEIRYRSIYKIPVYTSTLRVKGRFDGLPLSQLNLPPGRILWKEAELVIGLSDFRGIADQVRLQWDTSGTLMNSGAITNDMISSGLSSAIPLDSATARDTHAFALTLQIKGSEELSFSPVGKTTTVQLSSPWKDPEFSGSFLPEQRTVTDQGFTASWKVLHLNREFPQYWKDQAYAPSADAFGVQLLTPVDGYSQTLRTVKYAILVILLTFFIYFFIEILQKRTVHALQYILVGAALCIFYLLVLSLSEYITFFQAYSIAALATVLLIAAYTAAVFRSLRIGGIFAGFMGVLYGFIYALIRMQDGSLLVGSIGLFVILALIMYFSRKIDWSDNSATEKEVSNR